MCRPFSIVSILAMLTAFALPAVAEEFPLQVELNTGNFADYGTVYVTEDSGDLLFEVQVNPMVAGSRADLHRLYFNLHQPTTNLSVETLDSVARPYSLRRGEKTLGGGGAFFDWSVDFGSGASTKKGNGVLQHVSFRISGGNQALEMDDIMSMSASKSKVSVHIATHLQGASAAGESVSTVGAVFDPGSATPGDVPPPDDQTPPSDDGCTWVFDLFTGEPLYQICG
jgi:hypothetical protein